MELMTLKEIKAELEANNLMIPGLNGEHDVYDENDYDPDYFDSSFHLHAKRKPLPVVERPKSNYFDYKCRKEWEAYYKYQNSTTGHYDGLSFSEQQSTFSCAIPEFGQFTNDAHNNKTKLAAYWHLLINFYMIKAKHGYFRCSTPDTKEFKYVIEALEKLGFEKRAKLHTKHDGDYHVIVWEYVKKKAKA